MTTRTSRIVVVDQTDPTRGRCDLVRMGNPSAMGDEDAFVVPPEDIQATRDELAELRRRLTRKSA